MPRDRRPRVAYVLKVYPRYSQTFILNEILAHEAAGLRLEIFSLRRPRDEERHRALGRVRARVTYIDGVGPDPVFRQAAELADAVQERGIGHLHAHFGNVATTVARQAALRAGIPYTFTAHARDIFHDSVRPADLRRKIEDAVTTVTVSRFNVDHLTRTFPMGTYRLVYNGLDLDEFAFDAPTDRPPLILGVGRLVEKKGFEHLIDACALLDRAAVRFRCEIAGSGPLQEALETRIRQRGLERRVRLLGALTSEAVRKRMRRAAVLAAPCVVAGDGDRDGLPTVLLEAMALGTPCVSTDVTGIPEVVRHRDTGWVAPQRDADALAEACRTLLGSPELRLRLARSARSRIEADFDIRRNARRLRQLFSRAVRGTSLPLEARRC